MASFFLTGACRLSFAAVASLALTVSILAPSSAGMRDRIKDKMVDGAADNMVSAIQSDSCLEFAAMIQGQKSGGSDKSSKMKNDPAARQRFVNKVAGPLLNKMIDCDMVPGK